MKPQVRRKADTSPGDIIAQYAVKITTRSTLPGENPGERIVKDGEVVLASCVNTPWWRKAHPQKGRVNG